MKASEILKKPGDVAVRTNGDAIAVWQHGQHDRPIHVTFQGGIVDDYESPHELIYSWQPLLTREQWQAEQDAKMARAVELWGQAPLTLRKLEPGEQLRSGKSYVRDDGHCLKAGSLSTRCGDYDYYEVPDLSVAAEPEVVRRNCIPGERPAESLEATQARILRVMWLTMMGVGEDEIATDIEKEPPTSPDRERVQLEAVLNSGPAPKPEDDGTRYMIRINNLQGESFRRYWSCNSEHGAGWLDNKGPQAMFTAEELQKQLGLLLDMKWLPDGAMIVQVPPEPPKWLGAVRETNGKNIAWVTALSDDAVYSAAANGVFDCHNFHTFKRRFTLAPDIMPPSPELAALFEGGAE